MAKENEDILQANAGSPAADIPDLKKKDKERKKAGAAWSGVRGAGEFTGATGGSGAAGAAASAAASAAAEGAGLLAAEGGGFFAGIMRFLAGMAGTLLGKLALAAAAFLLVAAAGLLGYSMMKGNGNASVGTPNLGAIADSMHVHEGGDDRTGVDSKGEVRFDPLSAAKPAATAPPTDVKAAGATPAPDVAADSGQKPVPTGLLAHNMNTALSSGPNGGSGGATFGNKNIFGGGNGPGNFNAPKFPGAKGKLGQMTASSIHGTPSTRSVGKGSANKAFGQLRLAKGLSLQGSGATSAEAASASAAGAFDQAQPTGGALGATSTTGDTPPGGNGGGGGGGGGAPDTTLPNVCSDPSSNSCNPASGATDPGLDNALAGISSLISQAISDIAQGTQDETIGMILIAAGIAAECCPISWAWGAAMIVAGAYLYNQGSNLISKGKSEAAQAEAEGAALAASIGNQQQGNAINYCTQQALANGTPVSACQPPDSITYATADQTQTAADIAKVKAIPVGTAAITPQK